MKYINLLFLFLPILLCPTTTKAQVNLSVGNTIMQNFDGMTTSATATLPSGWRANTIDNATGIVGSFSSAGTTTTQRGGASMSSSANSGIYNFGAGDPALATDRAVGGLSGSSSAKSVNLYVDLLNNGGTTTSSYIISYDIEKYRNGSNAAGFTVELWYSTDGTNWSQPGPAFTTDISADADNDGNVSVPISTVSVASKTLTISVTSGSHLYLVWNYSVTSGSTTTDAQALGIDNVSVTALGSSPSPLFAAGALSGFGSICINTTPSPHSFMLVGTTLNGSSVTVGPLTGYGFSTSAGGPFTSTVFPSYTGSNLNATIYVQFNPTNVQSYNGNISVSGGGASSINVAVTGAGVSGASPTVSSGTAAPITAVGATVAGNITYGGCSSVTAYGIEYSTVNGFANGAGTAVTSSNLSSGIFSSAISGLSPVTTYYYHAYATNSNGTSYGVQQSFTTIPLQTVAIAATGITATGFTARWNATPGAANYRLDVSTTNDFLDPATTRLVYWTFPVASADSLVDTASSLNTAQYITVVGTSAPSYSTSGATSNAARATSWSSGSGTKYWQIRVNTTDFYDLSISSKQRSSSTGPRDFKIQYKIRAAGTWTDLAVSSVTVGDNFTTGAVSRTLPAICENQDTVFIRWIMTSNTAVGGGSVGGSGASLIDDILINGRQEYSIAGYNNLTVSDTFQSVTGLSPSTTYYYRVRVSDGSIIGANSNVITTNTLSLEEALQVVALPATDIKIDSFTAHWNSVPGAINYYLDVSTSNNFVDTDTTRLAQWVFPLSSADATVDTASALNVSATITTVGTSSPTFSTSGATSNAARATSWSSGSGTKYWQIIVNSTGFYNLLLSSKQRSSSTGPRDFKVQYKIKAAGTWADITSPSITVADNFTTGVITNKSLPSACDNQDSVFVRWIMTSNTAVGGGLVAGAGASLIDDILVTGNPDSYVAGYKDTLVNDTSLIVTGLSPNTTYYYRVRATDGTTTGLNSNIISVTTLEEEEMEAIHAFSSEIKQNDKNMMQDVRSSIIDIYPNPASGNINVKINVSAREKVTCLIMSIAGYKVKEVVQNLEAGSNVFSINLGNLSSGIYYLKCIGTSGNVFNRKFIIR